VANAIFFIAPVAIIYFINVVGIFNVPRSIGKLLRNELCGASCQSETRIITEYRKLI
jgi:hypothetical protein